MAAARYWRIVGIEAYSGGDLELSELQWFDDAGRVDASATVTCSHAPVAGSLAALNDDNLGTVCGLAAGDLRAAGFWIRWDMGSAHDVTRLRVAAPAVAGGLLRCVLQQSDDSINWLDAVQIADIAPTPGGGLSDPIIWRRFPAQMNPYDCGTGATVSGLAVSGLYNGASARGYEASGPSCQFEVTAMSIISLMVGVGTSAAVLGKAPGDSAGSWGLRIVTGETKANGTWGTTVGAFSRVSAIGVVVRSGALEFYENGVLRHSAYTGLPSSVKPMIAIFGVNAGWSATVNLGSEPFLFPISGTAPWAGAEAGLLPRRVTAGMGLSASVAASESVPNFSTRRSSLATARDIEFGGPGTIYGTTKTKGTPNQPTHARVVLLHQRSKLPVRETWSDPVTGAFAFTGIDTTQQFLALAEDAAGNFRPVAANRRTPEVLP